MEILYLVIFLVFGLIGMSMADNRDGIGKGAGFFLGALLGLIGLIIIAAIGNKKKEEQVIVYKTVNIPSNEGVKEEQRETKV